jgi:hypothetical protein
VSAFVNVNGLDRVLNPGPLSRRPDKSTTTPRSATVFFITVRTVMTLLIYCNEENRTNRVVSLLLARNSFDPF